MSQRSGAKVRRKIALKLASAGFRIIPVKPGTKKPAITEWVSRATIDTAQINNWFEKFPDMNYGIVGGSKSGLFLLDCDLDKLAAPEDGWLLPATETYRLLVDYYQLDLDGTFTVKTPSGGRHHYFKWPDGLEDRYFTGRDAQHRNLGRGMDFEAAGGMVLGPGSVFDGRTYMADALGAPLAILPEALIEDLKKRAPARITERSQIRKPARRSAPTSRAADSEALINPAWVDGAIHGPTGILKEMRALASSEGSRDNDCWNAACQLAGFVNTPGAGLTEEKGFDLYIAGTVHLVSDDFDQQTIEEKWERALAAAQPVSIPAPKRRPGPVQKAKSATEDELKNLYRDGVLITQLVAEHISERWNIQIDDTGSLWFYDSTHSIFRPLNTSDDTAGGARADIARILLNDNSFSGGRVNTLIDAIHATRHLLPKIDMDKSARYIPFRNGVLDRETREFLQHSPESSSTFVWRINYDPDASCPVNDRQVELTMAPDAIDYYWEFVASMLFPSKVGATQKAWVLYGTGNEGKSTCMETVRRILGGDGSVSAIPLHDLNPSKIFRVAELRGKRANIVDDVSKMPIRDSAVLKSLILGEPVYSERKNEHGKHFRFGGSMAFGSNHVFNSPEGGEAWFRRFMYLHFPTNMDTTGVDQFDEEVLRTGSELSGVFNKALEAADRLDSQGFTVPDSAKSIERMFQNPGLTWRINQWLEDADGHLTFQATGDKSGVSIKTGDAWKAFKTWAASKGIPENELPTRNNGFHPYMRLRFTEKKFEQGGRHYLGLSLARKLRAVEDGSRNGRGRKKIKIEANLRTGEILSMNRRKAVV